MTSFPGFEFEADGHYNTKVMLTYDQALQRIIQQVPPVVPKEVDLVSALDCVLAEEVAADLDLPPFDKALMDGYAVRSEEVATAPAELVRVGVVGAGQTGGLRVERGETVQVMTGAPLPPGADAVQRVEDTRELGGNRIEILRPVSPGQNVAPRGREVRAGAPVLTAGTVLGPAQIGILASFGKMRPKVYFPPKVLILATGDELVDAHLRPAAGQIRNSNGAMLVAQCRRVGVVSTLGPIVADAPERIRKALRRAGSFDVVVFSGGVSMGLYDYIPSVLREEGVELGFHKAAVKPGKPILVGRSGDRMVFGLPGNPVSSFVTFELFVRPALRRWMGHRVEGLPRVRGVLSAEIRQRPGRLYFKPARTRWVESSFQVDPIETTGSADLVGFSKADSLLMMPAETAVREAGTEIDVLLLDHWGKA